MTMCHTRSRRLTGAAPSPPPLTPLVCGLLVLFATPACEDGGSPGDPCGNGRLDPGEVCDGDALSGETCFTRAGHIHGELACLSSCLGFDTTGCHTCGNGVVEGPEPCDGDDYATSCLGEGYDGGAIGCFSDCRLDLSGCIENCGNGTIDSDEECEPGDLQGRTCADYGSPGGVLACGGDCLFDTSGCATAGECGNGHCEELAGETPSSCPADCQDEPCPAAAPGGPICVAGIVRWFVDPSTHALMTTAMTEPAEVLVYDSLQYAVNPNVPPLAAGQFDPATGYFKVEGITVPGTGFIMLTVDDPASSGIDALAFTGTHFEGAAGRNIENVSAYAISRAQDTAWSAQVPSWSTIDCGYANPSSSFGSCGTLIGVFAIQAGAAWQGIDGVTPEKFPGPSHIAAERVFYLDATQTTLTPATGGHFTGPNGVYFHAGARLGSYTGICGQTGSTCSTQGYTWDQFTGVTSGSSPTLYTVQVFPPEGY